MYAIVEPVLFPALRAPRNDNLELDSVTETVDKLAEYCLGEKCAVAAVKVPNKITKTSKRTICFIFCTRIHGIIVTINRSFSCL